MRRVDIEEKKYILDDFFKVEEAHLRYERFDGKMSPPVRRLNFERGDSVAVIIFKRKTQRILLVNQFEKAPRFPSIFKAFRLSSMTPRILKVSK